MTEASPVGSKALDALFTAARTYKHFSDRPVPDTLLRQVYDLAKMAPTASNGCPMRLVFVRSPEAKARLEKAVNPGNLPKVRSAPVTVIVAHDMAFYEHFPKLAPHMEHPSPMAKMPEEAITRMVLRNSSIQAGFLILRGAGHGAGLRADVGLRQRRR